VTAEAEPQSWADLAALEVPGGELLPGTAIEVIRRPLDARGVTAVLFDFDGTLSLIRSGWMEVMVPMMVEVLAALGPGESHERLTTIVREFVYRLNGRQTIYQMIQLADEVRARGGTPLEPLEYKRRYHALLWERIKERVEGLRSGAIAREAMIVPGALALLARLRERGLPMYCASGTDQTYTRDEAALLGLTDYFEGHVYGAIDNYQDYSKRMVIEGILTEHAIGRGALLAFGDGFVEIEDTKAAGGIAVGVATDEPACERVDDWKRKRLILAGADAVIPNYREHEALLRILFGES
jgi:phosphoglycolate phosphatase